MGLGEPRIASDATGNTYFFGNAQLGLGAARIDALGAASWSLPIDDGGYSSLVAAGIAASESQVIVVGNARGADSDMLMTHITQ